jgi:hypothetical protein
MSSSYNSTKLSRSAQLALLKKSRTHGRSYLPDPTATTSTPIYSTLTEEEYHDIVKGRLDDDDFIEDDMKGSGYVDQGQDEFLWEGDGVGYGSGEDESEEERRAKKMKKTNCEF